MKIRKLFRIGPFRFRRVVRDAPINCLSSQIEDGQRFFFAHLSGCVVRMTRDEISYLHSLSSQEHLK